ncbi:MAG: hypothetical protein IPN81_08900 [Nitrosomonadales bacterium]|nr:hypothetical protein [Nitrosomonadales bacterium]
MADLLAAAGSDLASVDALELSKLAETDGDKTIAVRNFGDANLLLVDEGQGLAGKEESGFMARRNALSARGFVFEYSATFTQAMATADSEDVTQSYAKSVLALIIPIAISMRTATARITRCSTWRAAGMTMARPESAI